MHRLQQGTKKIRLISLLKTSKISVKELKELEAPPEDLLPAAKDELLSALIEEIDQ
jgi:hypothetical protein